MGPGLKVLTVSLRRLHFDVTFVCVTQKVKDLEGQIESLSGTTTPHSDDSQPDKLPPVDPATVTNLVSLCSWASCLVVVSTGALLYLRTVIHHFLLPPLCCVCTVSWVGCINVIKETVGSGSWSLSIKILTQMLELSFNGDHLNFDSVTVYMKKFFWFFSTTYLKP